MGKTCLPRIKRDNCPFLLDVRDKQRCVLVLYLSLCKGDWDFFLKPILHNLYSSKVFLELVLMLIHTRYFYSQYCDKKIKRSCDIWQYLATDFYLTTKVHACKCQKVKKCILFGLLRSVCIKALRKMLVNYSQFLFHQHFKSTYCDNSLSTKNLQNYKLIKFLKNTFARKICS